MKPDAYPFVLENCVVADVEVYPGRWCAGFRGAGPGRQTELLSTVIGSSSGGP